MSAIHAEREISVEAMERAAVRRLAQKQLLRIDEMRDAYRLHLGGMAQRDIAETLHTTQPRVHRMLKSIRPDADQETAEEVILRAVVEGTDRNELVARLQRMTYTFTEYAPEPFDGSIPGTWNQVAAACLAGFLTREEYERVASVVKPPVNA